MQSLEDFKVLAKHGLVLTIMGIAVLFVPGETQGGSVSARDHSPMPIASETNQRGGFLYSDWLRTDGAAMNGQSRPTTFGSFVLSRSLLASVYDEVKNEWRQILQDQVDTETVHGWLGDAIGDGQLGPAVGWKHYSQDVYLQLAQTAGDRVLGALAAGAEEDVLVIRSVDWDLQTSLGDQDWHLGVSFLGPLRETSDDAVLWQLRGYRAKHDKVGGNLGLIYRQAREGIFSDDEAMYGGNFFLDYESGNDGDFWRWSFGAEYRSELLAFYGNRYLVLTDGALRDGEYVYSADGYDLEVAWQLPNHPNVSGFVGYYLWEGENGDGRLKGIRYGTRLSFGEQGPQVELELDSPEGSSKVAWGLRLSYLHHFGAPSSGAATTERHFDPRHYFYNPVKREYEQKIRRSGVSGGSWQASIVNLASRAAGGSATGLQVQLFNDEVLTITVGQNELPYSFAMLADTTLEVDTQMRVNVEGDGNSFAVDWGADTAAGNAILLFIDQGRQMHLSPGDEMVLQHNGQRKPNIEYFSSAAMSITLSPQQEQTELYARATDTTLAVSLYAGAVAFVQNTAASVIVIGRQAEAQVWTTDGITVVVGGCGSGQERKDFVDNNGVAINARTYCAPIVVDPIARILVDNNNIPSPLTKIVATGGAGEYFYTVIAGADFSMQGDNLFLSATNDFYLLTVTVEVSDNTGVSTPGIVVITVEREIGSIVPNSSGGYYRVAHREARAIDTLSPTSGLPPYSFVLTGDRRFRLVTKDDTAEFWIDETEGPALFTVTVQITDQTDSVAVDTIFTVEVLAPVTAEVNYVWRFIAGNFADQFADNPVVANIMPNGGNGDYVYRIISDSADSFNPNIEDGNLLIAQVTAIGTQTLHVDVEVEDTFSTPRRSTVAVAVTVAGLSFSRVRLISGVPADGDILIEYYAEITAAYGCDNATFFRIESAASIESDNPIIDATGKHEAEFSENIPGIYTYEVTLIINCGGRLEFYGTYQLEVVGSNEVSVPLQELPANRTFTHDLDFNVPVSYTEPHNFSLIDDGSYVNNNNGGALFTMDGNGILMVTGGDEREGLYNNPYMLSVEISDSAPTPQRVTVAISVVLISLLVRATEADLVSVGISGIATGVFEWGKEGALSLNQLSATEDFDAWIFAKSRDGINIDVPNGSTLALKSDDGSFVILIIENQTWTFFDISWPEYPSSSEPADASELSGVQVIRGPPLSPNLYLQISVWYCRQNLGCEARGPTNSKLISFAEQPLVSEFLPARALPFAIDHQIMIDDGHGWRDSYVMVRNYGPVALAATVSQQTTLMTKQALDRFSYLWGRRRDVSGEVIAFLQPLTRHAEANYHDSFMLYRSGHFFINKPKQRLVETPMFQPPERVEGLVKTHVVSWSVAYQQHLNYA